MKVISAAARTNYTRLHFVDFGLAGQVIESGFRVNHTI